MSQKHNLITSPGPNSGFGITSDVVNLHDFCQGFYQGIKVNLNQPLSWGKLWGVISETEVQLTRNLNIETPSVFKRAAALTVALMVRSPLEQTFKGGIVGEELIRIKNHQNAIVAFEYCRDALRGAVIMPKKRSAFTLEAPIMVSKHFYCDLIHSFSHITDHSSCFHSTALLYESLCYKANKTASDPEVA